MFSTIRRIIRRFFRKSGAINNQPLNKVSLIVIILVDIFILINVFTGLHDISQLHISPGQAYPCYSPWQSFRFQLDKNQDEQKYKIINRTLEYIRYDQFGRAEEYQRDAARGLGELSQICIKYGQLQDKVNNPANNQVIVSINQKQSNINQFQQKNNQIRAQYDSTLLEKIADQPREQSINQVGAAKAKAELDKNNRNIANIKAEISKLKNDLINKPENINFLNFIQDNISFKNVEKGYNQASFWYPSIQLAFQSLFLIPLIAIALFVHRFALRKGYGLISLISWYLLVIFFIPLVIKFFEFLQLDVVFQFIFNIVQSLLGGLLFLVSYIYILFIPLFGFVIIKFFQKVVFNTKIQAANRAQKSRCVNCAKKIRQSDSHCPHCGYYQYTECENCHNLTYKHLPYCKHCGHPQSLEE